MRGWMIGAAAAGALALAAPAGAAETFYIKGGGDGHGIGLSQYGAYGFALHGKDYRFILGHYYQGTSIGHANPSQTVRVLLRTGSASFAGAGRAAGKRLNPSMTYTVRVLASGWLGVFDSRGKKIVSSVAPLRVTGPGPIQLAGTGTYRGALEFRADPGGGVDSINAVGLEDYVRGVVSAEMPAGWAAQALRAQAVAARTYAITSSVGASGYQLYADTRSQMYQGLAAETPSTDAAVAATRGQVVTYGGRPIVTYFFASSGGHTEDVQNVWLGSAPEPWLRGVSDPYDGVGGNPDHRWTISMTMAQAAAKLGRLVKGTFLGIKVTHWGVSPRVVSAKVVGTRGSSAVSGPQLQETFGLMSTYMDFAGISSSAGTSTPSGSTPPGSTSTGGATPAARDAEPHAALAVAIAGFEAVAPGVPVLRGTVFGGRRGERLQIQRLTARRWRTVARARLGAGSTYRVRVSGSGQYRVLWHGLDGPAITLQ